MRYLSLFSGIGAFEKALTNVGIPYDLVNYCEIDDHAAKCYSALHNEPTSKNLGDITTIDPTQLGNIDFITHGSPCQDFSTAGLQAGGELGSGTRSSLLWETVRIASVCKPSVIIWENVPNVLRGKHREVFNRYLEYLNALGYNNYVPTKPTGEFTTINSKDFNIPQSRERVFVVSIAKERDTHKFKFPQAVPLTVDLSDLLDFRDCDNITDNFYRRYLQVKGDISYEGFLEYVDGLPITSGVGTKKLGLYSFNEMDTLTTCTGLTGTLTCRNVQNYNKKFWYNRNIYKPSPRMCFRLMGFTDSDFDKVCNIGGDKDLWNRAGNSIVVDVAAAILKELFLGDCVKLY